MLDVNDSPPRFERARYSAVVPENAQPGALVVGVRAKDPDSGEGGEVTYSFPEGANGVSRQLYRLGCMLLQLENIKHA